MLRGCFLALALLGCSASSGAERRTPDAGESGSSGAIGQGGSSGDASGGAAGDPSSAGSAGAPDLCQDGDERLCSCAPGYGGKQTCSPFGWNLCSCPDWPPPGSGGSAGAPSGPTLGSDCTFSTDECASMTAPTGKPPVCMQSDGLAGGSKRPGHCTWTCTPGAADAAACIEAGGDCKPVGELVTHCVAWEL